VAHSFAITDFDRQNLLDADEWLDRIRHRLGEDGRAKEVLTRADAIKEREAETNRVSEVQDLGRVQQNEPALSYTLH